MHVLWQINNSFLSFMDVLKSPSLKCYKLVTRQTFNIKAVRSSGCSVFLWHYLNSLHALQQGGMQQARTVGELQKFFEASELAVERFTE